MKNIKTDPVKTCLTITVGFLVVYLITKAQWPLMVALAVGLIGMLSAFLAQKVDWLWMKLTWVLSKIVPNILLGAVFFLFLFPIAVLSRLFGKKDPMMLKNTWASTWIEEKKAFDPPSFESPW